MLFLLREREREGRGWGRGERCIAYTLALVEISQFFRRCCGCESWEGSQRAHVARLGLIVRPERGVRYGVWSVGFRRTVCDSVRPCHRGSARVHGKETVGKVGGNCQLYSSSKIKTLHTHTQITPHPDLRHGYSLTHAILTKHG